MSAFEFTPPSSDAEDIAIADAANDFTATDVEGALAELQSDHETDAAALTTHEADTTNIHGITNTANLSVVGHAHAGEDITSGTVADARIASTIARDSEVTTAVSDHSADTTSVHGIADTSALETTTGAQTKVDTHVNDTSAAHAASAISVSSTTLLGTGTDAQAVFEELDDAIADHLADATAAHAATAIAFTPDGSIAATTVQAAIVEVRDEAGGSSNPNDMNVVLHMAVFA